MPALAILIVVFLPIAADTLPDLISATVLTARLPPSRWTPA